MVSKVKGDLLYINFDNNLGAEELFKVPFNMENVAYLRITGSTFVATNLIVSGYSNVINIPAGDEYVFNNGNGEIDFDISMSIEIFMPAASFTQVVLDVTTYK
tara:strand:- start:135 stop:443 length:309 start_codon:yes stop_codon:yes gene_type:complete